MKWLLWAFVLLIQNYCFTWVSRARNGDSLREHVKAAIGSNGVYFLQIAILTVSLVDYLHTGQWGMFALAAVWYTLWTVIGSITSHYILIEKNRGVVFAWTWLGVLGVASGIITELFFAPRVATSLPSVAPLPPRLTETEQRTAERDIIHGRQFSRGEG